MKGPEEGAVEAILSAIEHLPPLHRTFRELTTWLCAQDGWAVAVWGSLARGEADRFSDLDLTVLVDSDPAGARKRILERIEEIGRIIVSFSGSHIGKPDLLVAYLEVDGWPVKIDLDLLHGDAAPPLPPDARVLHPDGPAFRIASAEATALDVPGLEQRFCGWIWYTYGKLARGELFQAARSIDFTRENALLPLLLVLRGLPPDGHRRIERRLPPPLVQQLVESYPTRLEAEEIRRALLRLTDVYLEHRAALEPFRGGAPPPDPGPFLRAVASVEPGVEDAGWARRFYGDDYLNLVDRLLPVERTEAEVEFLVSTLGLGPGAAVADVGCGTGRHALALARRGLAVTGMDINPDFIARAESEAARTGSAASFRVGDMRAPEGGPYDAVLLLYQTFGFFRDDDNEAVLSRWAARLAPGGHLVLDLWNRDRLLRHFRPQRTFELRDGTQADEHSAFDPRTGHLHREFVFRRGGAEHRYPARFRLYAASELRGVLRRLALEDAMVYGSLDGAAYDLDAERMVFLVRRSADVPFNSSP